MSPRNWKEIVFMAEETGRTIAQELQRNGGITANVEIPESAVRSHVVGDPIPSTPSIDPQPRLRKGTRVVKKTNVVAKSTEHIVVSKGLRFRHDTRIPDDGVPGPGRVRQLVVKAQSQNYRIILNLDDTTYLNDPWSDLNPLTKELDAVAAYQDGSKYVASISEVFFLESMTAAVVPDGATETTFDLLFLEVELDGEI